MTGTIASGGIIGILGGGQLGRMLAMAAAHMGYRTHVYCPEENCPAAQVSTHHTCASYDDEQALIHFAKSIDVATFEFENVPATTALGLADHVPVRPSWKALEIAQDRAKEKRFFADIGAATAPWRPVPSLDGLIDALAAVSTPAILKTSRLGYDGKGQVRLDDPSGAEAAWAAIGGNSAATDPASPFAILEGLVRFTGEVSVITARALDGSMESFEPVENVHKNHILHATTAPANIPSSTAKTAIEIAERAAEALDLVGLLTVELFVTSYGGVLVNEMAPRPHNSGHWTLDGCITDQFSQLIRAICGLPLGNPRRHSDTVMTNLLGEDIHDLGRLYADPNNHVYVYGKDSAKPGRKMGHVNKVRPKAV
jgi:5-(carboxyamino)imidazole ribonucleotide synthase